MAIGCSKPTDPCEHMAKLDYLAPSSAKLYPRMAPKECADFFSTMKKSFTAEQYQAVVDCVLEADNMEDLNVDCHPEKLGLAK